MASRCPLFYPSSGGLSTDCADQAGTVAFDQWYTARIEANPNTAELSFYLDGALVGKHTPSHAAALLAAGNLQPKIGVWNGAAGTTATRYVDEVRVTLTGP